MSKKWKWISTDPIFWEWITFLAIDSRTLNFFYQNCQCHEIKKTMLSLLISIKKLGLHLLTPIVKKDSMYHISLKYFRDNYCFLAFYLIFYFVHWIVDAESIQSRKNQREEIIQVIGFLLYFQSNKKEVASWNPKSVFTLIS